MSDRKKILLTVVVLITAFIITVFIIWLQINRDDYKRVTNGDQITETVLEESNETASSSESISLANDSEDPLTTFFTVKPKTTITSRIVGYMASGAFITYLPDWIDGNWKVNGNNDDSSTFSPINPPLQRDFSDIVFTSKNSSELFNADWLFETEKKKMNLDLINAEILTNNKEDLRIYHTETMDGDNVSETYFIDGNGKTAIIKFSSNKHNYYYYSPKIKEFIRGLTLNKPPRG